MKLGPRKNLYTKAIKPCGKQSSRDNFDLMSTISKIVPVGQVHPICFHLVTRFLGRYPTYSTYMLLKYIFYIKSP